MSFLSAASAVKPNPIWRLSLLHAAFPIQNLRSIQKGIWQICVRCPRLTSFMEKKEQGSTSSSDFFFFSYHYLSTYTIFFLKNLSTMTVPHNRFYKVKTQQYYFGSKLIVPPK